MSYAMQARQNARTSSGKYRDMNRCERCNKRLGDNYCSDGRVCDEYGVGLVLCEKDADRGLEMSVEDALAFYSRTDR